MEWSPSEHQASMRVHLSPPKSEKNPSRKQSPQGPFNSTDWYCSMNLPQCTARPANNTAAENESQHPPMELVNMECLHYLSRLPERFFKNNSFFQERKSPDVAAHNLELNTATQKQAETTTIKQP